tara:strand:+ start:3713 stop:3955 length:243 start_codon:yes stop_codon:yes gene_type:complete
MAVRAADTIEEADEILKGDDLVFVQSWGQFDGEPLFAIYQDEDYILVTLNDLTVMVALAKAIVESGGPVPTEPAALRLVH